MKTIKWGIIGAGKISSKFAVALNSLDDTEIAAIASRDICKAKEFANQFKIHKAYGSYQELVEDPDIDVVYIGIPHSEHKSSAELCITHGKAVLCEKPFTMNQKEAQYLISLAKEYNVFMMEAMWTKFLPVTKVVKQWIQDGRIGNVKYYDASFGFLSEFNASGRLYNPSLGGGALLDVGIYPIAYVIHMMGKLPDQVVSNVHMGKSNVDEMNVVTMTFKEGVMANLSSAITVNMSNQAIIYGEKGKIVVPHFWKADLAELHDYNGNLLDSYFHPLFSNGYTYEAIEVNTCLREGKTESDVNPLHDTLEIMKLMDSIRAGWGFYYPQEIKSEQ